MRSAGQQSVAGGATTSLATHVCSGVRIGTGCQ